MAHLNKQETPYIVQANWLNGFNQAFTNVVNFGKKLKGKPHITHSLSQLMRLLLIQMDVQDKFLKAGKLKKPVTRSVMLQTDVVEPAPRHQLSNDAKKPVTRSVKLQADFGALSPLRHASNGFQKQKTFKEDNRLNVAVTHGPTEQD